MTDLVHDVTTTDGRTLRVLDHGATDGVVVVAHHGTPGAGVLHRIERESAKERGLRLIAYDRPGYAGSTVDPGRTVASAAADVAAILDALEIDRFVTYGTSGGGPHALACAAGLPERCMAAATIAGVAPADAPGLVWTAGMGEGNVAEFAAASQGREHLIAFCLPETEGLINARPQDLADEMRPHLSDVDAAALSGELAEFLPAESVAALAPGVEGWVDDDLAFIQPWGIDLATIRVPVLVLQGERDLMVPPSHGAWLGSHVAGARWREFPDEGHLTLFEHRVGEVHEWLAVQAR